MFKQLITRLTSKTTPTPAGEDQPQQTDETSAAERPPAPPSPWKMPDWQAAFFLLFALVVGIIIFLRLFELSTLQAEIYGDIEIVIDYVKDILAGKWPVDFVLSAGPLYHYLITPIIALTGPHYDGAKLASVIVSLMGLACTYVFSRKLINDTFALLVLFISGVSFWWLIFSRLGNSQIMLPLLTTLSLWLVLRVVKGGNWRDVIICAVASSMGLFVYPQSFILPGVIFATLLCLSWTGHTLPRKWAIIFILACIPSALFFGYLVAADPGNFNGYIGGKFQAASDTNPVMVLIGNVTRALLAFHVRGDEGFRSNPNTLPHLDWISGLLFLGGIAFWLSTKERRRWFPLWLVPFLLLQVPSMLVISQPAEVPSASRTLGAAPIAYLLVASGLWGLLTLINSFGRERLTAAIAGLITGSILILNAQIYFQVYIPGMPYEDIPIGRQVAAYVNTLPPETQVYVVGCCWEHSIPESFLSFELTRPENLSYIDPDDLTCQRLDTMTQPTVFIWSFYDDLPGAALEQCKQWLPTQLYEFRDKPTFKAAALHKELANITDLKPSSEILKQDDIQLNDQLVHVEYSPIDIGSIGDLFDGNRESLMRGRRDNPIIVVLHFPEPRMLSTVELDLGSMQHFQVTVVLTYADNTTVNVSNNYENMPDDPHLSITLPTSTQSISTVRVMVQDMNQMDNPEPHIHLRELSVK